MIHIPPLLHTGTAPLDVAVSCDDILCVSGSGLRRWQKQHPATGDGREDIRIAAADGYAYWLDDPHPAGVRALRELQRLGHRIHVIAARGAVVDRTVADTATRHWMHQHHVPADTITVISADVGTVLQQHDIDVLVDTDIVRCGDASAAGVNAFLFDTAGNRTDSSFERVTAMSLASAVQQLSRHLTRGCGPTSP
jgi:hypothetical protein